MALATVVAGASTMLAAVGLSLLAAPENATVTTGYQFSVEESPEKTKRLPEQRVVRVKLRGGPNKPASEDGTQFTLGRGESATLSESPDYHAKVFVKPNGVIECQLWHVASDKWTNAQVRTKADGWAEATNRGLTLKVKATDV